MRDITISVSEDEYHALQAYALYLRKQEQELYSNTAREASDDWMVEDVVMLGIRDRMVIFRMMQEVGEKGGSEDLDCEGIYAYD